MKKKTNFQRFSTSDTAASHAEEHGFNGSTKQIFILEKSAKSVMITDGVKNLDNVFVSQSSILAALAQVHVVVV
jgi:hypothetical protein